MAKLQNVICLMFFAVNSLNSLKVSSVAHSYKKGLQAYEGERWSECVVQFEESLHLYKLYKTIVNNCRLKCNSAVRESYVKEDIEDLKVIERYFRTRNCLVSCQNEGFEHVRLDKDIDDSVISNMENRKLFEYLHICYFQMNALPKAASAVYTFLVSNPEDEAMQSNLNYYAQQPEVDTNEIVDILSEDYMVLYKLGVQAYKKNNWAETIASMEEVLTDYFSWENSCRVECERQPQQEWSPDFTITLSNNMAALLYCRQQCQGKLKDLGYSSGVEFLADILNFLQISYYRLDKIKDASKAVQSYLSLIPDDEDMLVNLEIYSTLTTKDAFVVRSDVSFYSKRDSYEKMLLNIFHQGWDNTDINTILFTYTNYLVT